jgi:hypothetical protein
MHTPERWPYGNSEDWWTWRDHLDHIQDPNIATLKREADCEIARISCVVASRGGSQSGLGSCLGGWGGSWRAVRRISRLRRRLP